MALDGHIEARLIGIGNGAPPASSYHKHTWLTASASPPGRPDILRSQRHRPIVPESTKLRVEAGHRVQRGPKGAHEARVPHQLLLIIGSQRRHGEYLVRDARMQCCRRALRVNSGWMDARLASRPQSAETSWGVTMAREAASSVCWESWETAESLGSASLSPGGGAEPRDVARGD